jgi:two-component system sensor histidine kinase UhpB
VSLRLRLNLILTLVFVVTLVVGATYTIANARRAIGAELGASIELASRLLASVLTAVPANESLAVVDKLVDDLNRTGKLRHLRIEANFDHAAMLGSREGFGGITAPAWFVRLVGPEPLELVRVISAEGGARPVVVRADPSAEISEAWQESRTTLITLLIFALVANGLIYVIVGRSLQPLARVSAALEGIEHGRLDERIPTVGLADIDRIAERFNHMADGLQRSRDDTQALARRSLAIQEDERRSLAQELHDELGQSISAIKALAVSIEDRGGADSTVAESARTIADVSSDIYDRVRTMMTRLRPVALDELGLVPTLQNMIDDWNDHHEDVFCEFNASSDFPPLDRDASINVFRIIQEALTNVVKHAKADRVQVDLFSRRAADDGTGVCAVELNIADDGVGFDLADTPQSLGLLGIRERVEAMHGTLELTTAPNTGTQYRITANVNTVAG